MGNLEGIRSLLRGGRFAEGLRAIENASIGPNERLTADVLKADLLERTGDRSRSRALTTLLLKSRTLSPSDRAACELVMARIDWDHSEIDSAIAHLQRSISIASKAGDLDHKYWSLLRLMSLMCDKFGPESVAPIMSELRVTATALGDATAIAALHAFVGQMEAKRGLFENARRHLRLGEEALTSTPNAWLQATIECVKLTISIVFSDFEAAIRQGQAALRFAEQSGAMSPTVSSLANLGNLYFSMGRFDEATMYEQRAMSLVPPEGEQYLGCIETLARIRLAQGDLEGCKSYLDQVRRAVKSDADRAGYVHRHAELTRVTLLDRSGRQQDALEASDAAIQLATVAGDYHLLRLGRLAKAELLVDANCPQEAIAELDGASLESTSQPGTLHAHYERILAFALHRSGMRGASRHFLRAERICVGYGDALGTAELTRRRDTLEEDNASVADSLSQGSCAMAIADALQAFAALSIHARTPHILIGELMPLLIGCGAVTSARAIRVNNGSREVIATFGNPQPSERVPIARQIIAIEIGQKHIDLELDCRSDIESMATMNALRLLLRNISDLERARIEWEEKSTLWPLDELPLDNGQAVAVGEMRKLMELARRVASTNVSVLITGESGTGKEILARAVHAFSARADKSFVPLNCTAIPRDMLESQMFGHRRGAFTGADRDHLGVVRAARDGTLFLDEIGEMGLDLQPKILRFLESGEISPLGEPEPVTVNVRIIAATNSDLEQLVRDGRFREDLFYRLNVFRLSIPPLRRRRDEIPALVNEFLRRAAREFNKGHIRITEETMDHMLVYSWPGNIRQLQNEVRRMVALAEPNAILKPAHIAADIRAALPVFPASPDGRHIAVSLDERLAPTLTRIEKEMITLALRDHKGKVDAAARALGISRKGLYLKRQRLGL